MTFPNTPLLIGVDIKVNGAWVNITSDVSDDGITISRGRASEGEAVDPARMQLRLRNPDGRYTPRNTASPYYPIGHNTPIRVWVRHGANNAGTYDNVHYRFHGYVTTWPQKWTTSGDNFCTIEASGILRRLAQSKGTARSPIRQHVIENAPTWSQGLVYWPLEGKGALASKPAVGSGSLAVSGTPTPEGYTEFECSEGLPTLGTSGITLYPGGEIAAAYSTVTFLCHVDSNAPTAVIARTRWSNDWRVEVVHNASTGYGDYLSLALYGPNNTPSVESSYVIFDVAGADLLCGISFDLS